MHDEPSRRHGGLRQLPPWALWNPAAAVTPWSVGVEEEVALVDARDGRIANRTEGVLPLLPGRLRVPGWLAARYTPAARPEPGRDGAIAV
jgi:hypothetical protein